MCLWNGLTISLFPAGSLIEQLLFLQCKDFKVEEFSSLKSSKVYEGVQDLFLWLPNFLAFTMQQVFNKHLRNSNMGVLNSKFAINMTDVIYL